jgi:hypothetical protein
MIEEIKIDKYKQNDYGDAVKMSAYEKTISFLNKYVVYKKISKITDIASVALELLEDTVLEPAIYRPQRKTTKKGVVVPAKKRIDLKLPKAVNLHKTIRLLEDVEIEIEEIEEVEEIVEGNKVSEEIVIVPVVEEAVKEVVKEKKARKPYTKKGALKIAEEEIAPPIAAPIAEIDEMISKPKTKKVAKPKTKKVGKDEKEAAKEVAKEMIVEVEIPVKKIVKEIVKEKEVIKEKTPKKAVKPRTKKDKDKDK